MANMKKRTWTAAQIASLAFGIWWLGNALGVFLGAEPSVTSLDANGTVRVLGSSIAVNGWHGLLHLLTGFTGIAVCWWPRRARSYAIIVGALYLAAGVWSVFTGSTVFGLIHADSLGSVVHAVEGTVLLAVGLASGTRAAGPVFDRELGEGLDQVS